MRNNRGKSAASPGKTGRKNGDEIRRLAAMRSGWARFLHDHVCQHATAIAFLQKSLEKRIPAGDACGRDKMKKNGELVNALSGRLRLLMRGLNAEYINETNLCAAAAELCAKTAETLGIVCNFSTLVKRTELDEESAKLMYIIAGDAVFSAAFDGKAHNIVAEFVSEGGKFVFLFRDDGMAWTDARKDALRGITGMNGWDAAFAIESGGRNRFSCIAPAERTEKE